MIDPIRHEQLEELQLVNLCSQILSNARNELYLNMHFLDVSLSSLGFAADTSVLSKWQFRTMTIAPIRYKRLSHTYSILPEITLSFPSCLLSSGGITTNIQSVSPH